MLCHATGIGDAVVRALLMEHADLPAVIAESTIEACAIAARDCLDEGTALVRRGDDVDGLRALGRTRQLIDQVLKLCERRPRNDASGRQVCSVEGCGAREIMPDGLCIEHGGGE